MHKQEGDEEIVLHTPFYIDKHQKKVQEIQKIIFLTHFAVFLQPSIRILRFISRADLDHFTVYSVN